MLAERDRRCEIFGADHHRYRRRPRLEESEVTSFERAHRIALPADLRAFLVRVGNGGAGPFYGLHALGEDGRGPWKTGERVGTPSAPFPIGADARAPLDGALPLCDEGCGLADWLVVTGPEAGNVWHDARCDAEGCRPWGSGEAAHEDGCVGWDDIEDIGLPSFGRIDVPELPRLRFLDWYEQWLDRALLPFAEGYE